MLCYAKVGKDDRLMMANMVYKAAKQKWLTTQRNATQRVQTRSFVNALY